MTYTVDGPDGHQTNFGFSEKRADAALSKEINTILRGLVAETTLESMSFDSACKHLKKGNDVNGWWFSSHSDPARAAHDISQRIRQEIGIPAIIELFDNAGLTIEGDCQSGTFLARPN